MQEFIPGQRWINSAQLEMGLGSVLKTDFRTVTMIFLATGETFVYSKESVPLTRVRFAPGDHIVTFEDEELEVVDVEEKKGLLIYQGSTDSGEIKQIEESFLNNFIQLNRPTERLFNGQIDRNQWFDLRYKTRLKVTELAFDKLSGLVDGRVSLIPHQLYIANEVANRYAPRVLLADEVGLGKTIEAGMILHHQLVTERVKRVLIVVPESLTHQWLVEMLRRFNLMFKVFDEARIDTFRDEEDPDSPLKENPFLSEQLVLCSLEFLSSRPDIFKSCRDAKWDLMVVDEAHHLQWSEEESGFEYQLIEQLTQRTSGVLLLTATPEQLGKSSHFARLRLLDAERFHDYQQFLAEESDYQMIADAVETLISDAPLDSTTEQVLLSIMGDTHNEAQEHIRAINDLQASNGAQASARQELIQMLLDRHGTGRVLFRNTRSAVKGFPDRKVYDYPLPISSDYQMVLDVIGDNTLSEAQLLLCPELLYQAYAPEDGDKWTSIDSRVGQLIEIVKSHRPKKILVITASAGTAMDLVEVLRVKEGINAAVFHEHMSLMDRDRAAAWFADQISGAQVMVCSEIGSEGRNFQFSHHLILFDLPLNPDLLEQRIGRLDRIGQTETINIHVIYLENTAQSVMFNWYHRGLSAFEQTCPTGYQVFVHVRDPLLKALHRPDSSIDELIDTSSVYNSELIDALQRGRDRLLEFNSCRPDVAGKLRDDAIQRDRESELQDYLERVFDCFGADFDIHSEGCYAINPGSHMVLPLHGLPDEGMTVTYERDIALSYEDITYMSWNHPLVVGAMDLIQTSELGNTSVIAAFVPGAKRGTILLESIYVLESASTDQLQSRRYMPPTTLRVIIDQTGRRFEHVQDSEKLSASAERLKHDMVRRIVGSRETLLRKMVDASERFARKMVPQMVADATRRTNGMLNTEIDRLEALMTVNPNVRQQEIDFFRKQLSDITRRIDESSLRLDGLRVIVAT